LSHAKILIQPVIELPELDEYLKGKKHLYGFNANKDGTMIAIVLPGMTIAKIVPKRIPSKNLLTFNNLYDVGFNYKKLQTCL